MTEVNKKAFDDAWDKVSCGVNGFYPDFRNRLALELGIVERTVTITETTLNEAVNEVIPNFCYDLRNAIVRKILEKGRKS